MVFLTGLKSTNW